MGVEIGVMYLYRGKNGKKMGTMFGVYLFRLGMRDPASNPPDTLMLLVEEVYG